MTRPFPSPAVQLIFDGYPEPARARLLELRDLIFEVAARTPGVGQIEEALRWGEPAYLTTDSGSGSTIRIAWKTAAPATYAMYFNCKTKLVENFRHRYSRELNFEGNRAVIFADAEPLPIDPVADCIRAALTYHQP